MVCRVCRSPLRAQLDRALVSGHDSLRELAAQYDISSSALHRHRRTCLPDSLVQAHVDMFALDVDGVLLEVERLRHRALQLLDESLAEHDRRSALSAIGQCRGALDLMVRTRLTQAAAARSGPGPYDCCRAYAQEYVGKLISDTLLRVGPAPPVLPEELADPA
jgi:hypothetical protein